MAYYRPLLPFTTPLIVLTPTYTKVEGVRKKVLPNLENGTQIFAAVKTYGGTEKTVDGILTIEDTAEVETWYRPDITSDCVIVFADTGAQYQILGQPENISMRNQFLKFKVRRLKGAV